MEWIGEALKGAAQIEWERLAQRARELDETCLLNLREEAVNRIERIKHKRKMEE